MEASGPFRIALQTRGDQASEAVELVRAELERFVEEGPTEQEVSDARRNIVGGFPLQIDSNAKLAGYLAMIGFYDLPLDYLRHFRDSVEAVDREAVHAAARSLLADRAHATVIVGGSRGRDDGD
jgi:zinc protease